jgi:signal transduction histidine kinase
MFPAKFKLTIVAKVSILAAGIAASASLLVGSFITRDAVNIVHQEELKYIRFVAQTRSQTFLSRIDSMSRDLKYLVGTPPVMGLPRALEHGGVDPLDNSTVAIWKSRLATIFSELLRAKPFYQQARYILASELGAELVRVDRLSGSIRNIPAEQLQHKGDTEYFQKGIRVPDGHIYLSHINLNREHGRIAEPHIPVLRALTPVYVHGKLFGLIVINMDLTDAFRDVIEVKPNGTVSYITNEQGYFLAHQYASMTFGFELNRPDNNVQKFYPGFRLNADEYAGKDEFTVSLATGVLHTVKAHFDPENPHRFVAIILATPHDDLSVKSSELLNTSLHIMIVLVLLSLLVSAVMARHLLMPLRLVTRASEDMARGRDVDYLPLRKHDEIGELARSFDNMHHQLEDQKNQLLESQAHSHHVNKLASLGEMASGMAHEINSPIQTIKLIAQRIKRQKQKLSSDDICVEMDKISDNISKVSEIIESLRKVSRHSEKDDFVDVALGEVIEDAVQLTLERFKINSVDFSIEYRGLVCGDRLQCKRIQLAQILINLLNNAFDAVVQLKERWIRLQIVDAGDNIEFVLSNSGPPIAEEIRDRLFEPLFTTKEIGKGTGLGLSISADIAASHRGRLYLDKTSEFTRFVLTVPRRQIREDASGRP